MMKPEQDARQEPMVEQKLIGDLREANRQMVDATIRAQELTDLAELAQARAEAIAGDLRQSEERYRTLFDLSPVAVYSCDASGVVQTFNRHAVNLWGREPATGDAAERFCGSSKLFRPDGAFIPHEQCPMAEVLSGKLSEVSDAEVLIERPDGSRVIVVVNIRPVKNERGEITAAINCFYDITARKQAEDHLAESLSRERELAEFREMFIGILGHDLRNPLSAINMAVGLLLRRGHIDEQGTKAVARIVNSSQRMTRMIAQLLDLTRARLGGGLPIETRPTDLGELCRNVADEFEAPIRLEIEGDVTGAWDPDRLAEVFSNLVGNAVEYAAPGTAAIIKAHADGAEVIVEVSNQGEPIPVGALQFIFEPFRRARQSQKSATGNLGLGLYIARQIILSHGGTLDVRSAGGTTTFLVRLPRSTGN